MCTTNCLCFWSKHLPLLQQTRTVSTNKQLCHRKLSVVWFKTTTYMYDIQYGCFVEEAVHTFGRNLDIQTPQHVCFMEVTVDTFGRNLDIQTPQHGCFMEETVHTFGRNLDIQTPQHVCFMEVTVHTFGQTYIDIQTPQHGCFMEEIHLHIWSKPQLNCAADGRRPQTNNS